MRPSWDDYFMSLAYLVSTRATCDRKKVGAVLVKDKRILSTGYNGAPSGMPSCDEVGHSLKTIDGKESCIRSLHAESNAIDFAGRDCKGATLYTTVIPCFDCAKRIVNSGIITVRYAEYYASRSTELVVQYFESADRHPRLDPIPSNWLQKWDGELISPAHIPDDILHRTATIQRNRE